MKKLLAVLVPVLLLTGCGSSETTTTCTFKEGTNVTTATFTSKGDKVSKQVEETVMVLDAETKAYASTVVSLLKAELKDIKGVTFADKTTDDSLTLTITVDYTKADFDELAKKDLVENGVDYISLEKTVASFEKDGYTCK